MLTRIRVTDLIGGETIKITCSGKGKGCPLKSKTYKNVKKGTRTLTALFGKKRKLKTGAKIVVTHHQARRHRIVGDGHDRQAQQGPEDRAQDGQARLERDVAVLAASGPARAW